MREDDNIKKEKVKALLIAGFKEFGELTGEWRPSLVNYAKWLGLGDASLDHYIAGRRLPDLSSVIIIGRKYPQIYEIMGFERWPGLDDPELRLIAENWSDLDNDAKEQIISIAGKGLER